MVGSVVVVVGCFCSSVWCFCVGVGCVVWCWGRCWVC